MAAVLCSLCKPCAQVLSWIVLVNFGVHHPVLTTISDPPLPLIHFLGIPSPSFSIHSAGLLRKL